MTEVKPEDIGLAKRAADVMFISAGGIAVSKSNDRHLQYYAGFDCIARGHRHEIGEYVFYEAAAERVRSCMEEIGGEPSWVLYDGEFMLAHVATALFRERTTPKACK